MGSAAVGSMRQVSVAAAPPGWSSTTAIPPARAATPGRKMCACSAVRTIASRPNARTVASTSSAPSRRANGARNDAARADRHPRQRPRDAASPNRRRRRRVGHCQRCVGDTSAPYGAPRCRTAPCVAGPAPTPSSSLERRRSGDAAGSRAVSCWARSWSRAKLAPMRVLGWLCLVALGCSPRVLAADPATTGDDPSLTRQTSAPVEGVPFCEGGDRGRMCALGANCRVTEKGCQVCQCLSF